MIALTALAIRRPLWAGANFSKKDLTDIYPLCSPEGITPTRLPREVTRFAGKENPVSAHKQFHHESTSQGTDVESSPQRPRRDGSRHHPTNIHRDCPPRRLCHIPRTKWQRYSISVPPWYYLSDFSSRIDIILLQAVEAEEATYSVGERIPAWSARFRQIVALLA